MRQRLRHLSGLLLRLATLSAAIGLLVFAVIRAIPPSKVVIEVGPPGGSYEQTALQYREALQRRGITLELRHNPDSLGIPANVNARRNGSMIGFAAQNVPMGELPNAHSLGAIELQPLFIFHAKKLGALDGPAALRGRRIVLPPERSATSQAALRVLGYYGVNPGNTEFRFMSLGTAVDALIAGEAEVGIFMLAASNPNILRLVRDPDLVLLNIGDATALSRLEHDLRPAVIPKHIYDFSAGLPPSDVQVLGAPINIVVNDSLHAGVVYALLETMAQVHRAPGIVNRTAEFPNGTDTLLPLSSVAKGFYASGTPWLYREVSIAFAGLVDYYLVLAIVLFLSIEIYRWLKSLFELSVFVADLLAFRLLARLERKSRETGGLRPWEMRAIRVAEGMVSRTSHRQRGEELIERIRARQQEAGRRH